MRPFVTTESTLIMKNVFYFTLKALLILKIFKFLFWLFQSCIKMAWLERSCQFLNLWCHNLVNKTIVIQILPNISRSKGNQTIKFDQLIEYNMRNIFIEKSYTKCAAEIIPRLLFKKQNWANLWIDSVKF